MEALLDVPKRDPLVVAESRSGSRIERRLEIPTDLIFLQGHFDGFPVVAGVVQLRWVMAAMRAWCGEIPHFRCFEALKFPEPLLPGQAVSVEVELAQQAGGFRFRVWDGARTFATGRIKARVAD